MLRIYQKQNGDLIILGHSKPITMTSYICPSCGEEFEFEAGVYKQGELLCALCEYENEYKSISN